jgi:hypothetical protein
MMTPHEAGIHGAQLGLGKALIIAILLIVAGGIYTIFVLTKTYFQQKRVGRQLAQSVKIAESGFYQQAGEELESGEVAKGIWAKALVEADGDDAKTRARYIKHRVSALSMEMAKTITLHSSAHAPHSEMTGYLQGEPTEAPAVGRDSKDDMYGIAVAPVGHSPSLPSKHEPMGQGNEWSPTSIAISAAIVAMPLAFLAFILVAFFIQPS